MKSPVGGDTQACCKMSALKRWPLVPQLCTKPHPPGFQHQKPSEAHFQGTPAASMGLCCRNLQKPEHARLRCWRDRRPYSRALSLASYHYACQGGRIDQIEFFKMDSKKRNQIRMARRLWRIFGQFIQCVDSHQVHRESGSASSQIHLRRRIHCDAEKARHSIRSQTRF